MKLDTLLLLKQVLNNVQLPVSADDFSETAKKVIDAKKELDKAIDEAKA